MSNLTSFVDVRWYSALSLLRSLLKNKDAIKESCSAYFKPIDINIARTLKDESFWRNVNNIVRMVYPINDVIRVAESDNCRLSDFLHHLLLAGRKIFAFQDRNHGKECFDIFLSRFKELNVKLLLACYLLDPQLDRSFLTEKSIVEAKRYTLQFAKQENFNEAEVLSALSDLKLLNTNAGLFKYDKDANEDSLAWYATRAHRPIGKIAVSLLSIKASSANVERLFSFHSWNHSAKRNRLDAQTLESIAKLKYYFAQTATRRFLAAPISLEKEWQVLYSSCIC